MTVLFTTIVSTSWTPFFLLCFSSIGDSPKSRPWSSRLQRYTMMLESDSAMFCLPSDG